MASSASPRLARIKYTLTVDDRPAPMPATAFKVRVRDIAPAPTRRSSSAADTGSAGPGNFTCGQIPAS